MADLGTAIQLFDATESNLKKLLSLWDRIEEKMPKGPAFGGPPEYDELCFSFRQVLSALPAIDGFSVEDRLFEYDEVGQMLLDARELGEIDYDVSIYNQISEQGRQLRQYRLRLQAKRRELVRDGLVALIGEADKLLTSLKSGAQGQETNARIQTFAKEEWSRFQGVVAELNILIGSGPKPAGWTDLTRHVHFGMVGDLDDIHRRDWPAVKNGLLLTRYADDEPIPIPVMDLNDVVAQRPKGHVPTRLNWAALSDEDFERLIFTIICDSTGYENPEWLQHTRAPDKGRDLSATSIENDALAGVRRRRVIVQCKHYLSKSISPAEVTTTRDQMELWQPPRVDRLVFATSGRFTADAIALIEKHNQSDRALSIEMWPDSHIELLLASRPYLIAQFNLRRID